MPNAIVFVMDAVGIKTLEYLLKNYDGKIMLQTLGQMGLYDLIDSKYHDKFIKKDTGIKRSNLVAAVTQASSWPDSVFGHQEMMGIINPTQYSLFPDGFSQKYLDEFSKKIGRPVIYNEMDGGEAAIQKNWHLIKSIGYNGVAPVGIYSSVCDPVLQIMMDEEFIEVKEQHSIIETSFNLALEMGIRISRAISRPYVVEPNNIPKRTTNRYDVILPLEYRTLIDVLNDEGIKTVGVSKAIDVIPRFSEKVKVEGNPELLDIDLHLMTYFNMKDLNPYSMQGFRNAYKCLDNGLCVVNFGDTDSVYGHTMNIEGTLRSLMIIDLYIESIIRNMREGDMLIVTADHGMEHRTTDKIPYGHHSIEPLPLLAYIKGERKPLITPATDTEAVVGYLVAQHFGVERQFVETCQLEKYFSLD